MTRNVQLEQLMHEATGQVMPAQVIGPFTVVDVAPDTPEWGQERRALCIAPECKGRPIARGMCNKHRLRYAKYKAFDLPGKVPVAVRMMRRVTKTESCWVWGGAIGSHGYGVIGLGGRGDGVDVVHRVSYRHHKGHIPEGLHIDHLCSNRICVNPDHLEAVTKAENDRRRDERRARA